MGSWSKTDKKTQNWTVCEERKLALKSLDLQWQHKISDGLFCVVAELADRGLDREEQREDPGPARHGGVGQLRRPHVLLSALGSQRHSFLLNRTAPVKRSATHS